MNAMSDGQPVKLLYAVTVPISIHLLRGQLSEMKRRGYEVTLLCSPGEKLIDAGEQEGIKTVPIMMARTINPVRDLVSLFKLVRYLRKNKPDITNVGTPKAGLLVGLAAWISRVPVRIYTQRGLRMETLAGWKRILLYATEKLTCAIAHRVWCISPSMRDSSIRLGLVSARRAIVLGHGSSNGLDMARFPIYEERWASRIAELRKELKLSSDAQVIGFSGRMTIDKGVEELVKVFDKLRDTLPSIKLLLVGTFEAEDPVPARLRERIENDPNIIMAGYQKEPAPYYGLMNVFLFPTYREGFGNVILEASAAGVPVVTNNVTGARDAVMHGESGLVVKARDVAELTNAVELLLTNPSEAERLGINGRRRVEQFFRSEVIWEAADRFYRELLDKGRGRT